MSSIDVESKRDDCSDYILTLTLFNDTKVGLSITVPLFTCYDPFCPICSVSSTQATMIVKDKLLQVVMTERMVLIKLLHLQLLHLHDLHSFSLVTPGAHCPGYFLFPLA